MYQVDAEPVTVTEHVPATSLGKEDVGEGGGRPMAQDSSGNVWLAGGRPVSKFDPRTATFVSFPLPKVKAIPEDYYRNIQNVRTEGQKEFDYGTYALTVDTHDN